MRTVLVIAAATLLLCGTITASEARFRGGRSSAPVSRPGPTGNGTGIGVGIGVGAGLPVRPVRSASPASEPASNRTATLRPIMPVVAPAPPPQVRTVAIRCPEDRLVGSGAGFCEIN